MRLALAALLLVACAEPGFMPTRPAFSRADVPITVCPAGYVAEGDEGARKMVGWATGTINERLGFALFKMVSATSDQCDVTAIVGAPSEAGWRDPGGDATFDSHRTTNPRCVITTSNTGTDEILGYVLEHELGHCAGLDHDDWDGSIMRRVQFPTPDGSWPPWVDDWDRALLRQTYRPQ